MPRRQQVVGPKKTPSNTPRLSEFLPIGASVVEVPFSYHPYTLPSKAALPTCLETCKTCVQHYLPESKDWNLGTSRVIIPHSDIEASQITADYVERINADRDAIRARLKIDADLLLKRWQRKSAEKRATIVRTAMPELHAHRFQHAWLLYEQHRAVEKQRRTLGNKTVDARIYDQRLADALQAITIHNDSRRKQHLLPFVDIETLSRDPMSLLALLHYRSESEIADWVMHDFEQLKVGFNWTMGPPAFNPHCVVMYGTHLGRLIPWNKQSAHRYDIIGYPRAVLILEAQAALFAFLRKTVEILLESNLQETTSGHEQWDALVQSDFGKIGPTPLVCRRIEAFRSPPRLDMAAIVESLVEQEDAILDELWLLQTDSQYFRAHMAQAKNNEMHDRLSIEWREQWVLEFALCYTVWADGIQIALRQARRVLKMQKEIKGEIRPGKSLPTGYEAVLVLFQRHLEQLFDGQLADLHCLVPQEKAFRDYYTILKDGEPKVNTPIEKVFLANPMLWNVILLYSKTQAQSSTFHLAFIDHLMHEDAKNEKSRISPLLATHISNMIAVDDIISSLRYHRPRHGPSVDIETLDDLARRLPRTLPMNEQAAFGRFYGLKELMWPELQAFINLPLPPSDEPAVLLKHLKSLDEASHDFWILARDELTLDIQHSGGPMKLYSDPTSLTQFGNLEEEIERRALRYTDLERAADEQERRKRAQTAQPSSTTPIDTPLQTTWGESAAPVAVQLAQTKPKVKTRPNAQPTSSSDDTMWDVEPVASAPSPQASIPVSPNSLILLTRMFTADANTPSEISWADFVSAMVDADCSVTPGGGSCFTFTHVDEKDQKHSMVFHRPHPEPSMSKERLRSFGSRLNRRWGWSEATFELKV